jgi:hypothetical protein
MGVVTEAIRKSHDRRVSYVIFNRRIFSSYTSTGGRQAWAWGPYTGTDPHTGHAHVSVNDIHNDETQPWEIGIDDMTMQLEEYTPGWFAQAIAEMATTITIPAASSTKVVNGYAGYTSTNALAAAINNLTTKLNQVHTVVVGGQAALAAKLDAILAAAQDDSNTTVVLPPDAIADLQEIKTLIAAVPTAEENAQATVAEIAS